MNRDVVVNVADAPTRHGAISNDLDNIIRSGKLSQRGAGGGGGAQAAFPSSYEATLVYDEEHGIGGGQRGSSSSAGRRRQQCDASCGGRAIFFVVAATVLYLTLLGASAVTVLVIAGKLGKITHSVHAASSAVEAVRTSHVVPRLQALLDVAYEAVCTPASKIYVSDEYCELMKHG